MASTLMILATFEGNKTNSKMEKMTV